MSVVKGVRMILVRCNTHEEEEKCSLNFIGKLELKEVLGR
jgi:hypothetical protein